MPEVETSIIRSVGLQVLLLFVLAIPVACISWTVTHEEIFREAREFCSHRSKRCRELYQRKFFYIFTCEYCFSHYVTAALLFVTRFTMVFDSWRGYLIAGFSLVWVANFYMAIFGRLKLEIKSQRLEIEQEEKQETETTRPVPAGMDR